MRMIVSALVCVVLLASSAMARQWHGGGFHMSSVGIQHFGNQRFFPQWHGGGVIHHGYGGGYGVDESSGGGFIYCEPWQGELTTDVDGRPVCVLQQDE